VQHSTPRTIDKKARGPKPAYKNLATDGLMKRKPKKKEKN